MDTHAARKHMSWLVLGLAFTFGCAPERGGNGETVVTDSAGLRIVSNGGADVPLDWTLERELLLGGRRSGPEAFFKITPERVGTDSAGNIYVLDDDAYRVVVFDSEGQHVRSVGREGDGPGEVSWPFGLSVKPDGTVLVDDLGKGRLVGFAPDGTPLDVEEPARPGSRRVFWGDRSYSDFVTSDRSGITNRLIVVAESDTTEVARLHQPDDGDVVELASCGMSFGSMPPVFAPSIQWGAWRGRAAVVDGGGYELDLFDRGRHVTRVRRAVEPVPATSELARRQLGNGMTVMTSGGPRECDVAEAVEQRGFAEVVPAIRDVRVDPAGRIWVSRGGPRPEPTPTDVLASDGGYIGTLPDSVPYPIGFLADGRALVAETDELGVTRLAVYAVREQEGTHTE